MYNDLKSAREFFKNDRFAVMSGVEIEAVEKGRAVCSLDVKPVHVNSDGLIQGGAIFTLADSAFAVASNFETSDDCCVVTIESNSHFLATTSSKRLVAEASCFRDGHKICVYLVKVLDEDGVDVAFCTFMGCKIKK